MCESCLFPQGGKHQNSPKNWRNLHELSVLALFFGLSGSEKGVFWKRGLFRNVHFLEILENLEILEFRENPQTLENKVESDHFLENLESLEIPRVKRPLS